MKRTVCVILCVALCLLLLAGCSAGGSDVSVTVGQVRPGMAVGQIPVQVTYKQASVDCRIQWSFYDGGSGEYQYLRADNTIPSGTVGCLDIYCALPKGVKLEKLPIDMKNVPGGTFDGIRDAGTASKGKAEAWLRILYRFEDTIPTANVVITVDEVKAGMTVEDIPVSVQINGETVVSSATWIAYTADSYGYLEAADTIPENYFGRVDVYYHLPEGVDGDHAQVTIQAPGGTDEGTGELGVDDTGYVKLWSHIGYGTEPTTVPTTAPVTEPTTAPTTAPATEPTQPHSHAWVTIDSLSKPASCEQDGWEHRQCSDCGESYQEPLPAWGHSYTQSVVTQWPTCTQSGVRTISCVSCGSSYQETIGANGHNYSQVEIIQQATCQQSGVRRITCPACGDWYDESFPATGHNWSAYEYYNNRTHGRTCLDCGAAEEGEHVFADNFSIKCTVCNGDIIN